MQKNAITMCSYVCVAAAFSGFARWIQNQAAFELETGLMIPGSVWSKVAFLFCTVVIAGIMWLVRRLWFKSYYPAQKYETIIHGPQAWLRRITRSIAAVMVVGAVLAFLIAGYELYSSIVRTLCVIAIATAWAFVKLSEIPFGEKKPSSMMETVYVSLPAVMYIYWLIVSYRTHAANPSVWSFALEIFAISASALGTFYFAGYAFEFPKPYAAVAGLMAGAFLSLVTLMDSRNIGMQLMMVAGAAMQLYYVWMIVSGMQEEWPEIEIAVEAEETIPESEE